MFTGIVTAVGSIKAIQNKPVWRVSICAPYIHSSLELGCSISHDGVCLTVVEVRQDGKNSVYDVEVSPETIDKTMLSNWRVGSCVNLERPLKVGDELGGHIVQGHIDEIGEVASRIDKDGWINMSIKTSKKLMPFIAQKGSIAINGVSLTVNDVLDQTFAVMIIPHTATATTLGQLKVADHVNIEIDLMARYAARLVGANLRQQA